VILFFTLCFIVGLFFHDKNKERLFFTAYFLSGVMLFVPTTIIVLGNILANKQLTIYQEIANTFFELSEFLAFYFFFKKCLKKIVFLKYLKISLYVLLTAIFIFLIGLALPGYKAEDIRVHSLFVNAIEFFFLFVMCLAYFRELFTDAPTKNLLRRPSFLIVTCTFFYTILMIPFFLIANDVFLSETTIYNILFACHYVLLMILLFSILRAFLYKASITT
jgi:hypothetical protein